MSALVAILGAALAQGAAPPDPREWASPDPNVRFVEGSALTGVPPRGRWSGRASVHVRCLVAADGRLQDCEVVRETPRGAISPRDARRAFRNARLEMIETGPQTGDAVTFEIVVTQRLAFR
jgi:hypothetical protein